MPCVLWSEESKTGLGFEIGPSHDNAPMMSQCAFSCYLLGCQRRSLATFSMMPSLVEEMPAQEREC